MSDPLIEPSTTDSLSEAINQSAPVLVHQDSLPKLGRSFGWFLLMVGCYFLAVILYTVAIGAIEGFHAGFDGKAADPAAISAKVQAAIQSANGVAHMYILQFLLIMPLVFLASSFPQQKIQQTLAINAIRIKQFWPWLLALAVYMVMETLLSNYMELDDKVFTQMISGSKNLLLAFALVILAPIMEESIFRGYLFKAWRNTRLGLVGTLTLTSLIFALIHGAQYTWPLIAFLFVLSMLLGYAREKTGSIFTPIILHAINNLVSTITVVYLGWTI